MMKGNILKDLRKEKNLTQKQLADKLGIKQSTIASLEIGRREPSNELMLDIATFFDVSLDFLNGLTEVRKDSDKSEGLVKDLLVHLYKSGLIKDINNIDDTTKDIIMSMVKKELEIISKKNK